MSFIVNNGPIKKSMNSTKKININILISLIPILIYKTIITTYLNIIPFLIISILNIGLLILFDLILENKKYKFDIHKYVLPLIILFVSYLFIKNIDYSNIYYIAITNQLILFINRLLKFINPLSIFLILEYIVLKNDININYNIYILAVLILISILYLMFTKSIKFRIVLLFLLTSVFSLIFTNINFELLLILSVYVIPYFYSTPVHAEIQYIYGVILGLCYIFLDLRIFILVLFILSFFIKYIDLHYSIILAKKKS